MNRFDGRSYQARFDALSDAGVDIHGEAAFIRSLAPASVLDGGCGTGRVAIELARHEITVVGVDIDPSMIAEARRRAPTLRWIESDLSKISLEERFDVVVLAGNVPLFCPEPRRDDMIRACGAHLERGGALVAGFELGRGYPLDVYDGTCQSAGLVLVERWSSWDRDAFDEAAPYAVSIHRREP